ncbi:MAG: TlpA disulfide reductase family protein [Bdellovibrionota bacterium]|nr:TlpA disulfide reductase family protein [Bdellovibrionota bacterium]
MKKFLPAIFIALAFTFMVVSQMLINGKELSASRVEKHKEKYSLFESNFSDLKINTTKGSELQLAKVQEPIVILNFWASWCQPCVREFQSLNALLEKYPSKIKVVGINNDTEDALKEIKKIETKYDLKFESMADEKNSLASKFNISRIPSTIVFHKGKVIEFSEKEFDFMDQKFVKQINEALE